MRHVRKGEKGSLVVYANSFTKTEQNDAGEDVEREIPFLKGYTVFNCRSDRRPARALLREAGAEIHPLSSASITPRRSSPAPAPISATAAAGPTTRRNSTTSRCRRLRLSPTPRASTRTLAHETLHWTKHPTRLDREFGRKSWGDAGYAHEELVAELGSAFLCADLELTPEVRDDHASYIAFWLEVLKNDNRAIFAAAAHAQRAVDYLHKLQPERKPRPPIGGLSGIVILAIGGERR